VKGDGISSAQFTQNCPNMLREATAFTHHSVAGAREPTLMCSNTARPKTPDTPY
jgi:hypothetical protein